MKHRKKDDLLRLNLNLSTQICNTLKKDNLNKNGYSWETLVGYTVLELKSYLESLFVGGMSWNNHGTFWEIDHIVPRSFFNFEISGAIRACWSFENLMPIEKQANREKSNQISEKFENFELSKKFQTFSK